MSLLDFINKEQFVGLTSELTDEQYHASAGISSTGMKKFLKTPAHFLDYKSRKQEDTDALQFGRIFHARVLEKKPVVGLPRVDGRTKEGKVIKERFLADNAGKLVLSSDDYEILNGMADSLERHPVVKNLLSEGKAEQSGFVKCSETGLYLKARFDWMLPDGLIVDLKTTSRSAAPEDFERQVFEYGYHISAAWYLNVLSKLKAAKHDTFILIAVEKTPPYLCSVSVIKAPVLELGMERIRRSLPKLRECLETNSFPGYSEQIHEIGIPLWAIAKEEMKIGLQGEAV